MKNAIVIPALEPKSNLIDYVIGLFAKGVPSVIVVNDGSSSEYDYIFNELTLMRNCKVLVHKENRGKGAAIKTAVKYIKSNRDDINGIITVDADGQHAIEDVLRLEEKLCQKPKSLVLGVRDFGVNTPIKSKMGNTCSSKALNLLYGIKLKDTQTGLRGISREYFGWLLELPGNRYEYELNMLIYSKKIALPIITIPIQTLYFNNNDGSHYKAFSDSMRISLQMLKGLAYYINCSVISAITDICVFTFLMLFLQPMMGTGLAVAVSATGARITSSVVDFVLNKSLFASKNYCLKTCSKRYYILWISQLSISVALTTLLSSLFSGVSPVIIKYCIDLFLAALSYQLQLRWVFKDKGEGTMGPGILFRSVRTIGRLFVKKSSSAFEQVEGPAVLVGHHQNLYGPMVSAFYAPDHVRVWALSDFLSIKTCFNQYYKFTFTERANIPKPIAFVLAGIAALFVPAYMKSARAIPVYRKSNRVQETFAHSLIALENGQQILIFPDIAYNDNSDLMDEMYVGFLKIDNFYHSRCKRHLPFVPLCFHKGSLRISAGQPLFFDGVLWGYDERCIIANQIQDAMNDMVN